MSIEHTATGQDAPALPPALRIGGLFAGRQRGRERIGRQRGRERKETPARDEAAVEARVVRALYGDPVLRQGEYGTCPGSSAGR